MKRATAILCVGLCLNFLTLRLESATCHVTYSSTSATDPLYAYTWRTIYVPGPPPSSYEEWIEEGYMETEDVQAPYVYEVFLADPGHIATQNYNYRVHRYTDDDPLTLETPAVTYGMVQAYNP